MAATSKKATAGGKKTAATNKKTSPVDEIDDEALKAAATEADEAESAETEAAESESSEADSVDEMLDKAGEDFADDENDESAGDEERPVAGNRRKPVDHESFAHRLYVSDFNIAFIEKRHVWYLISGILLLACAISLIFRGLNLGVEFTGGSVFNVSAAVNSETVNEYTEVVNSVGLADMDDLQVTTTGSNTVRIQTRSLSSDEVSQMRDALAAHAGIDANKDVGFTLIGPSWGTQITHKGIQALIIFLALVAIMIGLYFRNWKMSMAALIALLHDLIITVGVYSMVGFTVTPATITGVLTILGYSLYDTVVVFDKVRENTVNLERKDFTYSQAADLAVNQVFVRSINTTIIGVLPILSLLVAGIVWLGGQGPLPDLGLAMFVGMIAGAWSSIFIATPILAQLKETEPAMKAHRESLERRLGRAQTNILITSTVADLEPVLAGSTITAAPVPVRHAAAAGRPQPERRPRSQRKG